MSASPRTNVALMRYLLALALMAAPLEAAAEGLRLGPLVAELKARSPANAAATQRIEAARLRVGRARALPEPTVQAMLEDVPLRITGGMPMVRLQATQMLPWFGKRDLMAEVSAREADAAVARAATVRLDVVAEGKRLFHELLLNKEARRINREQRAIVDTVVAMATSRLRSGTGMHHDVLKMQTEASMLDDELIMLDAERREMAAMLNALLDRPAETAVPEPEESWTPEAVVLDRPRIIERAVARRPELREMVAMEAAERAMAAAARREYYPDVMVGGLYDARMGAADALGAMIGLNVPLWIGSRQRLDVHAAEARARAVERDRAAMAAMVRAEIERALAQIEAAQRRLALLDTEFLPRAQQTFDAALAAFPSGMVDALSVLDDLRALQRQRLGRTTLRIARELALVELERASGVPLDEMKK